MTSPRLFVRIVKSHRGHRVAPGTEIALALSFMARKQHTGTAPARMGRPPNLPQTELGRWLAARKMTSIEFCAHLKLIARSCGLRTRDVPASKTLLDAVSGRHWPHPKTILLVEVATEGAITCRTWVRDHARASRSARTDPAAL